MESDIILEFSDKRRLVAKLAKPFQPNDGVINVFLQAFGEIQQFLLAELCCVLMKYDKTKVFQNLENAVQEEVTTFFGKTYHVYASEEQSFQTGFFGLSIQEDTPHRLIFFCRNGVRVRCQKRLTGQILESQGVISSDSVQTGLEEQQRLKKRILGETIADKAYLPRDVVEEAIEKAKQSGAIPKRAKIGEVLVALGLLTQEQVENVLLIQQKDKKKRIGELLIENGYITEEHLLAALAHKFRTKMTDLSNIVPDMKAIGVLSSQIVRQFQVFPVMDKGDRLIVATSDPTDYNMEEQLRFITGRRIGLMAATSKQIADAIEKYYPLKGFVVGELIDELSVDQEMEEDLEKSGFSESDSQIVNIVNKILVDAYSQGASDIHFEPGMGNAPVQIRYRIDGLCRLVHQIPILYKKAIISRIKIMANLDITERRKPQSGKILLNFEKDKVEYRVETTPTAGNNEDAVLRILASSKPFLLNQLSFSPPNLKVLQTALSQPYGIILCVGPTGSGKTTTLHAALAELNTPDRKIWTVEDPVEITQAGLRQVQIKSDIGLNFAEVLRSFLRSDPDVIMIGEMRDSETAKIAIEASLTGHLVLSTLHTNNASETIVRLIEMGMDPFNFSDALILIVAQRLARRLCDHCKKPYCPDEEEYATLVHHYDELFFKKHNMPPYSREIQLMKKQGCDQCSGTGYRGRIGIHEVLVGKQNMKKAIKRRAPADELRLLAIEEGMKPLIMDGIQKIFQGSTDLSQVLRVCSTQAVFES